MPRPGLLGLVTSLTDEGIRIAVATTGRRAWVEPLLGRLLGGGLVEAVGTGDDVTRLKPDP
jgi:beta-phosphoglucomutase-like phosphatase (HAD superfamily)